MYMRTSCKQSLKLMQTVAVYGIHMLTHWCRKIVVVGSVVAKPWHTRACARATFACALAFWPEDPADVISEVLSSKLFLGGGGGVCPQTPLKERASAH